MNSRDDSGPDNSAETSAILNVAALPSADIADAVTRMSADLFARGGLFHVDGKTRFAHMTLYMARFPCAEVESAQKLLADAINGCPAVRAHHTGFYATPGHYYEVSYARSEGLLDLHRTVMRALHDHRFSPGRPVVEDYFAPYTPAQKRNAEVWGYDLAEDLYRPHITVTRFGGDPPASLPHSPHDLSFEIESLGLFYADNLGGVNELIARFPLGRAPA